MKTGQIYECQSDGELYIVIRGKISVENGLTI